MIVGIFITAAIAFLAAHGEAQQQDKGKVESGAASSQGSSSAHDGMGGMDMSDAHDDSSGSAQSANDPMSGHHMNMGAHMFMTDLHPENPADEKRAETIVSALRPAIAKYEDYNVALADGFKIFHPEIPQEHYHFTNYANAIEAQFRFDPARPTSLLYKKTATGYELEGAMYTAPKRAAEAQLDERVPLSVAR